MKITSGLLLLFLLRNSVCIPLNQFYPFGTGTTETTNTVPTGDDNSSPSVSLQQQIRFFGQSYTSLFVNTNGAISFSSAVSTFTPTAFPLDGNRELIAPYWGDVDTTGTGTIYYRESTLTELLTRASTEIRDTFPVQAANGFTATKLFIATWDHVGYYDSKTDLTNTFQCVIATDGLQSFAIFLYADGEIQWTTGDASNGTNGLGGTPAQVGFNAGDGVNFAAVPASRTADIINIASTSNVGIPGVWIFQINEERIVTSSGCIYNGVEYLNGQQIQPNCSTRCTCREGEFQCEPQACLFNGPTCYAAGDPHYKTFDLCYYDFQGDCEYVLTTPCNNSEFTVTVRNSAHNSYVSCTDQVTIVVPTANLEIVLGRGGGGTVTINDIPQTSNGDGVIMQSNGVEIIRVGGHPHVLLTTLGVRIFWDGRYRVDVTVSTMWQNKLCGLCGNYNGDSSDDFETPDGTLAMTPNSFGNSWLFTNTSSGCAGLEVPPTCPADVMAEATMRCEVMQQGVFAICNAAVDPTPFIEDCMFDYCLCNAEDREDCYCNILSVYAAACASVGLQPPNWRRSYCPIDCPIGMVYQQCGSLCPPTCDNTTGVCNGGCAEGCFCPDGQLLRNGMCVDPSQCQACVYMGMLYEEGEQIQPNCSTRCTCREGEFECERQTCLFNGPTCYASGDPHYKTFDLRYYDFQGDCEYVLTTPCNSSEFTVTVRNSAHVHNPSVSCTDQVTVVVPAANLEIVLGRGGGGTVTINDIPQTSNGDGVIMQSNGVEVIRVGGHPHVLLTTHGVRVFWNGQYHVDVTVSSMWKNRLCGLCGNYNGDNSDDFMAPNGDLVATPNVFGNSWLSITNTTDCGVVSPPDPCPQTTLDEAERRCAVLRGGVFSACNAVIDPSIFIQNCEFDFCFCSEAEQENCYCDSLAAYATECAAAGVSLPNWRRFYCPIECPSGMVYQQCGALCPQVCYGPTICNGGCAEGCFCPDGQVVDDEGQCVERGICGECDIGEIDLVFLLDSSFSIRREGLWPALRDFTVQISSMLNIGLEQSLVGLIRFTRRAEIIFNLQEHTSNDTLIPALQSVPQGRGTTRTHTALRLLRQSATDGRMGLREGYTHIAIIVTDGRSIERDATIIQANLLHEENIYEVYAVGIGADIRIEELNAIASSPSQVFFMNEFAATAMQQVGQKITQELCSRQYNQPEPGAGRTGS